MTSTFTRTHVFVGFANPYLICTTCAEKVPYWHDPDRCGCSKEAYNAPCGHALDVISICPSWSPVDGCSCKNKEKQHARN